jgi:hypothetical protein
MSFIFNFVFHFKHTVVNILKLNHFFLTLCLLLFFGTIGNAQVQSNVRTDPGGGCLCIPVCVWVQPVSPPAVCPDNGFAQFTVVVSGTAPFTYQWRENGVILSNNAIYNGTSSPTLTITNPPSSLNGKVYRCIVNGCSGSAIITNYNAVLSVNNLPGDINNDGITDSSDFMLFLQQLNTTCSGCPEDINQDGVVDNEDFLQLLGHFNKSCM